MKKQVLIAGSVMALWVTSLSAINETRSSEPLVPLRPFVENGMKRDTVMKMFGTPSAMLSPDVWVYFDHHPNESRFRGVPVNIGNPERYDTLVICFESDRVNHLRLCDSKPVRAFLARLENRPHAGPKVEAK